MIPFPPLSRLLRVSGIWAAICVAFVSLSACGGDSQSMDLTPEDIDQESSISATEEELSDFTPPSDGVLTEEQVVGYLKTSLLQLDLIRKESEGLHQRLNRMEERQQEGGTLGQLQNLVDAGRSMAQVGELVGGSYIRSARALGYNPAEMDWVREQMAEIASYLMMKPVYEQTNQAAADLRLEADQFREQAAAGGIEAGQVEEQIQQMLAAADQMEVDARAQEVPPHVLKNLDLLHRVRPAVTDDVWGAVGFAGGSAGLVALTGFSDPNDAETRKKMDEFRQAYQNALDNRPTNAKPNVP